MRLLENLVRGAVILIGLLAVTATTARSEEPGAASDLERARGLMRDRRFDEAYELLDAIADRAEESDDPATAEAAVVELVNIGIERFDLVAMRDATRRLLSIQEHRIARTRIDLGYLESALGNHARGIELLQSAVDHAVKTKNPIMEGHALARLAHAHTARGEHANALDRADRAAGILRARKDHLALAQVYGLVGTIRGDLGDHEGALAIYQRALEILPAQETDLRADVVGNVGIVLSEIGRLDEAEQHLRDALKQFTVLDDQRAAISVQCQLGLVHAARGHTIEARKTLRAVQEHARTVPVAALYARLAETELLIGSGALQEASRLLDGALEEAERLSDMNLLIRTHVARSRLLLARERPQEALAQAERATRWIGEMVEGLHPLAHALGRAQRGAAFTCYVEAAVAHGDLGEIFSAIERSRAGALRQGLLGRAGTDAALTTRTVTRARERLAAAKAHLDMAIESHDLERIRDAGDTHRRAWIRYEEALATFHRDQAGATEGSFLTPASLSAVETAVPEGAALVLYALASTRSTALVVTRTGSRAVDLGPGDAIAADCRALDPQGLTDVATAARIQAVRDRLVAPLGLAPAVKTILVSPDGAIASVPFAVVTDRAVALVPSGTVYRALAGRSGRTKGRILAVGDPDYSRRYANNVLRVHAGRTALSPLRASRAEVESITQGRDLALVGGAATEGNLRKALLDAEPWSAVHLACHGFTFPRKPSRSSLALVPADSDDGFLTALEIFGLRIRADVVVLAACGSARGTEASGEGLIGLTQAFLYAGARRVVASLWKVDDEATRALMVDFHRHWRAGATVTDALRRAQQTLRARPEWDHPRFWGAWVVWGVPD